MSDTSLCSMCAAQVRIVPLLDAFRLLVAFAKTLTYLEHIIFLYFFFYLVCDAVGTAATPGLLCQPRVILKMIMEKQMECRLAGETEVLGLSLPQRHFCPSQNPT
jgi:hypothetical protein